MPPRESWRTALSAGSKPPAGEGAPRSQRMPRAARDACGAHTSRAEGSACRGPRRWRSGQGPGGGLQGDLEALSLSPPALVGPAAMGPSHGELLLRDCPKGPSGRCGRDDQRGGSGQCASSGARGRGAGPVHPSRLPSAQLPRRGWRGGSRSLPGGVSGEAAAPRARSQHLNTLSSNCGWEWGSHRHPRLQISLMTPSGRGS